MVFSTGGRPVRILFFYFFPSRSGKFSTIIMFFVSLDTPVPSTTMKSMVLSFRCYVFRVTPRQVGSAAPFRSAPTADRTESFHRRPALFLKQSAFRFERFFRLCRRPVCERSSRTTSPEQHRFQDHICTLQIKNRRSSSDNKIRHSTRT